MITLKNVSKYYYNKGIIAIGFTKINLELNLGEFVAITGESGSGKSTLLNVLSGLDSYEEGEMYIDGKETSHYTEKDFEEYRKTYISNIFQNFNLVNSYTVYQNIELVLLLNGYQRRSTKEKVLELIEKVGLTKYKNTKVSKLSGGQKQRVAIARALAKDTPIIIADEPTGNLDSKSAKEIIKLLYAISKEKLVIIVTHNYEQVENYVTRKIKMHDGKILEDKIIKQKEEVNYQIQKQAKNLRILEKIRIGIRNAFNIIPKFLLVLLVYLFITVAVTSEYAFFKQQEYNTNKMGYNNFFADTSDTRIIIKKKDKTSFQEEDFNKIEEQTGVNYIVKNDLLLDTNINLTDGDNFYFSSTVKDIANFEGGVDIGRLPQNDAEIILVGSKDDYYLGYMKDEILDKEVYIEDMYGNNFQDEKYKIVGIKYDEVNNYYGSGILYGSSKIIDKLEFSINKQYSELKVLFMNKYHQSYDYDIHYKIIPSDMVKEKTAYISSDLNYLCKDENCINQDLTIEVSNPYYQDKLTLKVSKTYQKKNMETILQIKDFDGYNGAIFINTKDYNNLYDKGIYQSSVFVKDVKDVDSVAKNLNKLGYHTLKIKDTLVTGGVVEALKIIRTIVTGILVITLFFISYFVIRIILKSRNIYFGTIRILGATKKEAKQLLELELLTVSNLAFFSFMILLYLQYLQKIQVGFLSTILKYLKISDYLLLYGIIMIMSYLISIRFARKIFHQSAMATMREEV